MPRLINIQFTAARKSYLAQHAPALIFGRCAGYVLLFHLRYEILDIITHQIKPMPTALCWMNGQFRRRQAKYQPTLTYIYICQF